MLRTTSGPTLAGIYEFCHFALLPFALNLVIQIQSSLWNILSGNFMTVLVWNKEKQDLLGKVKFFTWKAWHWFSVGKDTNKQKCRPWENVVCHSFQVEYPKV